MLNSLMGLEGLVISSVEHQDSSIEIKALIQSAEIPTCVECQIPMVARGERTAVYRDMPIGLKLVYLSIKRDRFVCEKCKREELATIPALNEKRKCTERMISLIRAKSLALPFVALSSYTGMDVSTIKSLAIEYAKELDEKVVFQTPRVMSINRINILDETRYLITNVEKQSLFNILDTASESSFKSYLRSLTNRKLVSWVFEDLLSPLRDIIHTVFPNGKSVVHKVKVVELMNDALQSECQLREVALDERRKDLTNKLIKIFTRKRAAELTQGDKKDLAYVYGVAPELKHLFQLKEEFLSFYEMNDVVTARFSMKIWVDSVPDKLPIFSRFSQIVRRSLAEIMHFWNIPESVKVAYSDSYGSLREIVNYVGNTHNYKAVRARLLYDESARKLTAIDSVVGGYIEYGSSLERLQERIG